jgi:phospholipid transport system substrate-binding protein
MALAAAGDPAAQRIDSFDQRLLEVMKQGKALGFAGRAARLKPAIESTLNLPVMTRYAVGPAWASMSEAQHSALVAAFTRMTVATYAHNFDSYGGETFTVDPKVVTRGPDKLVHTTLKPGHGAPVSLSYRMQDGGAGWQVIDVYYNGAVSELTTRRSDFSATVAKGGAPALISHIDALTQKLSK